MRHAFYDSQSYKEKQSRNTKLNIERGVYAHLKDRVTRTCARSGCRNTFEVIPSSKKRFCTHSCAAKITNTNRTLSEETKLKIAKAIRGRVSPFKNVEKVPRVSTPCSGTGCTTVIVHERYKTRKYCSNYCLMQCVGRLPTSPKASRGKSGIREDISNTICFYSRWEANIARLLTYLKIHWVYAPKTFDIGGQNYTPDFYIPSVELYVEVKNFWNEYSRNRDTKFRARYKEIELYVLLADEYKDLEREYAKHIPTWEYKNQNVRRR